MTKSARGCVRRLERITRKVAKMSPNVLFVFGDNMARVGLGGQAAELRGEPNAVGVPTKWRPARDRGAYFTDADLDGAVRDAIDYTFLMLNAHLASGRDVVVPTAGLGTGLAELPTRAPRVHRYIEDKIKNLNGDIP